MEAEWFVSSVDVELLCGICTLVMKDPRCCRQGHAFCDSCIQAWLSVAPSGTCPIGREPLAATELARVRPLQSIIDKLPLRCPLMANGCEWAGAAGALAGHTRVCAYAEVACGNACGQYPRRAMHSQHARVCPRQAVLCESCGLSVERADLEAHLATCGWTHVPCQHCHESVARREMPEHLQLCGQVPLQCKTAHRGYACCSCGVKPIAGVRLRSRQGLDFCSACAPRAMTLPASGRSVALATHGCSAWYRREDQAAHAAECPLALVTCGVGGCAVQLQRGDWERHQIDAAAQHAQMLGDAAWDPLQLPAMWLLAARVAALEWRVGQEDTQ